MNETELFDIVANATCFCCPDKAARLIAKQEGDALQIAGCNEHGWLDVQKRLDEVATQKVAEENEAYLTEGDIQLGFAYDNLMSIKDADGHISAALSYIMMAMNRIKKSKEVSK